MSVETKAKTLTVNFEPELAIPPRALPPHQGFFSLGSEVVCPPTERGVSVATKNTTLKANTVLALIIRHQQAQLFSRMDHSKHSSQLNMSIAENPHITHGPHKPQKEPAGSQRRAKGSKLSLEFVQF